MAKVRLPHLSVPADMSVEEMPDLLRHWYLGTRARHHMMMRRFDEVDGELDLRRRGRVLDIGSAWGYNVMALSRLDQSAVAMDLIVDQFAPGGRIARANGVNFDAVGGDAARLPFRDRTFDSITMVETFEHVYDTDRARMFGECFRVLRPGGRIVLSTPNYGSLVEGVKRIVVRFPSLRRRLPTMCYPARDIDRDAYHPYRYHRPASAAEICGLLTEAGFRIRRRKYFLFVLKNTPDVVFPLARGAEWILERLPLLRGMAATVCVVADRP